MIIYHGSNIAVEKPEIMQSVRLLDFGAGFYTTTNREQAVRWAERVSARSNTEMQVISKYEFDNISVEKELTVLHFSEPNAEWLDFVCANRLGKIHSHSYDIVFGPVANDTVYSVVQLYETGIYDSNEAIRRLKVEKLYNQILFHTKKSLKFCKYISFEIIEGDKS